MTVRDNTEASRFELDTGDGVALLEYVRRDGTMVITHTEVPPAARGRGLGEELARAALAAGREQGLTLVVQCRFVRAFLEKHPELGPTT